MLEFLSNHGTSTRILCMANCKCARGHAHQFAGAIWPWTSFECER